MLILGLSLVANTGYLIRTNDMRRINPEMKVHECIEGQNYQILLPMYYYYDRVYVDEPLAVYVIRNESHDHKKRSRMQQIQRAENLLEMLKEVLWKMNMPSDQIHRYLKMSVFNRMLENM